MGRWKPDLSLVRVAFGHTKEMGNVSPLEFAKGKQKAEPYTPFVAVDLGKAPWGTQEAAHLTHRDMGVLKQES